MEMKIEDDILKFIEIYTMKRINIALDRAYYGQADNMRLKNELEMYIHEKLTELINSHAKDSNDALINELCRYILHMSSSTSIEPQGLQNHKLR